MCMGPQCGMLDFTVSEMIIKMSFGSPCVVYRIPIGITEPVISVFLSKVLLLASGEGVYGECCLCPMLTFFPDLSIKTKAPG